MADWAPPAADAPVAAPAWTPPATDKPWKPPATDTPSVVSASTPGTTSAKVTAPDADAPGTSLQTSPATVPATAGGSFLDKWVTHPLASLGHNFSEDYDKRRDEALAQLKSAIDQGGDAKGNRTADTPGEALGRLSNLIGGGWNYATAPFSSAGDTIVGRPLETITGNPSARQQGGDLAQAILPFSGKMLPEVPRLKSAPDLLPSATRIGEREGAQPLTTGQTEADRASQATDQAAARVRTASIAKAARAATTPVTDFTPQDLGPDLAGRVNLRRFRSGKAATDRFTRDDLEAAGLSPDQIEQLRAKRLGSPQATSEGLAPAVTREEAPIAPSAASEPPPEVSPPGHISKEGPLSHEPALTSPREFEDQLFQLKQLQTADAVDAVKKTKALPKEITPELLEKMYAAEEPRGPKLTAEEQALYDEHVKPLREEGNDLSRELDQLSGKHLPGVTEESEQSEFHTPRYVKGRTRSFGQMLEQWRQGIETRFRGGAPGGMRKTVDAQKARRYYLIDDGEGGKRVAYVAPDRNVFVFDGKKISEPIGKLASQGAPKTGSKIRVGDTTLALEEANTNEIEAATTTSYIKNVFANRLDHVMKLRAAVRNFKFLDAMKKSPDWDKIAIDRKGVAQAPLDPVSKRPWRAPKLPQFQGYYMEPRIADAIDDIMGGAHNAEGLAAAAEKVAHVANVPMFANPLFHLRNVWSHYWVSKGLVGGTMGLPGEFGRLMKATGEVMGLGPEYIRALKTGASLPYARYITADLHEQLLKKLGGEMSKDPKTWTQVAAAAGMSPVRLLKATYDAGQRALWLGSDVMTLARTMELKDKGLSLEKAIAETERHMPNYRVPGQLMGKRWTAQLFNTPLVGRFGRYQYGRLASYFRAIKDIAGAQKDPAAAAHALDQMAALGVRLFVLGPAMDYAWQQATSNPNAKLTRSGAESVPQAAIDLANGDKDFSQFLSALYTPGAVLDTASELYHGRYGYSSKPIANIEDLKAGRYDRFGKDVAGYAAGKMGPIGQAARIEEGLSSPGQAALGQLGVQAPSDAAVAAKKKAQARAVKDAARTAAWKDRMEQQ